MKCYKDMCCVVTVENLAAIFMRGPSLDNVTLKANVSDASTFCWQFMQRYDFFIISAGIAAS